MRIAIACDHIGFPLKASIVEALEGEEHAVLDLGTHSPDPIDYPPMAKALATAIGKGFVDGGILLCESSMGGAMAGNRFPSIRAAACHDADAARQSREKLNVNLLCVGAPGIEPDGAVAIVREWVKAQFSDDERDVRTLTKINELDGARGAVRSKGHGAVRASPAPAAAPAAVAAPPAVAVPPAAAAPTAVAAPPAVATLPVAATPPAAADNTPKAPDITAVMKVVAGVTDADTKAIATRILQFIRNRFPTAAGTATEGGFTFTLDGQHVGTVTIGKNFVEIEAGPDRITTSKVRDAERLDVLLNLPSIVKAFDAIRV
jgi:ribose 5-phosphate isomerase B